ncbi:MAG TPA: c-type cytochrome [Ferruginibacter sp.]|nr:c-type cytochrome [Ferruginibacter sp.]HMP22361.1 c-type cytochrome [Ferruginibacter sp.]
MKRFTSIVLIAAAVVSISSCGSSKREPGKIYMPDMAYSRALETYSLLDSSKFTADVKYLGKEIFYNAKPVAGTIARDEIAEYTLPDDSAGYAQSASIKNPLPPLTGADSAEAARLYNINCGICHGADGKANGPLATSGKIGGVANLALDQYIQMADGTMYHSIYYGKNNMGSYASQLSRKQRWQMVQYIRTLQPKPAAAVTAGQ